MAKPDPDIWVDHTPFNLQFITTLLAGFPDARFVHIVRDGRAVAASLVRVDWGPNDVGRAAHFWIEQVAFGLAAELGATGRVTRVRYEDLVREPRDVLLGLCSRLELEFVDSMAEASGFTVPKYTVPIHGLIGQAPNRARIDAWRDQLTCREVEIFESIAGSLLNSLGYAPEFGLAATPQTSSERALASAKNVVISRWNKWRSRKRREAALADRPRILA